MNQVSNWSSIVNTAAAVVSDYLDQFVTVAVVDDMEELEDADLDNNGVDTGNISGTEHKLTTN